MAFNQVQICNMALAHLCSGRQIDDFEENSAEAAQCRLYYEPMRDLVLRDWPHHFSNRYADLAQVEATPNAEWAYSFRLPSDYIAALYIPTGNRQSPIRIKYEIGSDDEGRLLFADQSTVNLKYTARIEDPTFYPEDFVEALSLRLAYQIARPLSASVALAEQAMATYKSIINAAQARTVNEQEPEDEPEADVITARER